MEQAIQGKTQTDRMLRYIFEKGACHFPEALWEHIFAVIVPAFAFFVMLG